MTSRFLRRAGLATLLVLAFAGCGSSDRPSVAEWQPLWDGIVQGIPTLAELGQPEDLTVCADGLGFVRSTQGELFPTPDPAIDEAVREWVSVAEDAFFECPPSSNRIPDMAFAYGQLTRLEAEVAAALAIDRGEE